MTLSQNNCAGVELENFLITHSQAGAELSAWLYNLNISNHLLETKKTLAYQLLTKHNIAIPSSMIFTDHDQLRDQMQRPFPFVVKFDTKSMLGLQTVIVTNEQDLAMVWHNSHVVNGCQGLVQEFRPGREYTVTVLVGSHNWINLGSAVDYKKAHEHNVGPNTFGMGSLAPCEYVAPQTFEIVDKVVRALQQRCQYQGVLSCQFLLDEQNHVWFLEYNTRFCDPEFQSMLPRLNSDLITSLQQLKNNMPMTPVSVNHVNAVTVNLVHTAWPTAQPSRVPLNVNHSQFNVARMQGAWDNNTYWGSVTNSGTKSHKELAKDIYDWLGNIDVAPYRYRKDIGQ